MEIEGGDRSDGECKGGSDGDSSSENEDFPEEGRKPDKSLSSSLSSSSDSSSSGDDEDQEQSKKESSNDESQEFVEVPEAKEGEGDGEMEGVIPQDEESMDSFYSDYDDESDFSDIDNDEIDQLLEEGLPKAKRVTPKSTPGEGRRESEFNEKEIIVLEEKSKNTLEVLPGGWIEVRHSSGMPLYLHRKTRVCTSSKPYFLGPGSVRRHSIPLSAIPCLAYRRGLETEAKEAAGASESKSRVSVELFPADPAVPSDNPTAGPCPKKSTVENVVNGSGSESPAACPKRPEKRKLDDEDSVDPSLKRSKLQSDQDNDDQGSSSATDAENGTDVAEKEQSQPYSAAIADSQPSRATNITNMIPLAKVATAKENHLLHSITPNELRDYCKSLFKFKSVKCKRFKTWSARRKHTKEQKRLQLQRPTLPDGVKLISFPVHNSGTNPDGGKVNKEYIMNPQGKSSVCILHEYVQHALRKQPSYIFRELENAATPYAATVVINNMQYGTGYGSSKKQAKADAAKVTLEILIPQMKELDGKKDANGNFDILPVETERNSEILFQFFEPLGLYDSGVAKVCRSFSEPPPYVLLLTCLQRNFGQEASNGVKFEMISQSGTQLNKFSMEAGEHYVEVVAANKKIGKQLASQHLLAKLHPHITNFGAFIKLYGNNSVKSVKEKKQEEQQITALQSKASANSPNWEILKKLKFEMEKLRDPNPLKIPNNSNNSKAVQVTSILAEGETETSTMKCENCLKINQDLVDNNEKEPIASNGCLTSSN